jgi:copper chaperone CopZ
MSRIIQYTIEGEHKMYCAGCTSSVEYALSQLSGVKNSRADHRTQVVEVEVEEDVELNRIKETIVGLGYDVGMGD